MSSATCKRCGDPIIWLTLANGDKIPVDELKMVFIGRNEEGRLGEMEGRRPHWDTCPFSDLAEVEDENSAVDSGDPHGYISTSTGDS